MEEKLIIAPSRQSLRELGNTGIFVSSAGFGVHPIGPSRKNLSVEEGARVMCYAYEQGICFFDTAQFYGTYDYLKRALELIEASPVDYAEPVISSKSLEKSYDGMMAAIDEAIEKTGRNCIDIFLMHQVTPVYREERAGAREALIDAKKLGKVKAIGISTHHQDVAMEAADDPKFDVVFALYNYAGLGIRCGSEAGSAAGMREALKHCRENGKGVYSMKVFGGGNLTDSYQKAAKHVFFECQSIIESAVIGFTSFREVDELKELLAGSMESDYNPPIEGKRLRVDREDCMGCGTCVHICASGAMHYSPVDGLAEIDYDKCVSCSYCAIACPERAIVFW